MSRGYLMMLLLVGVASTAAPGQTTEPAAAHALDLSSPKATATSLYRAADRADGEAIRRIFYAETDTERQLADAYADMLVSARRLAEVAQQKFGGAADAFAPGAVNGDDIKRIESAEVKMQGEDRATVQLAHSPRPMSFRRGTGGWQLVISDFAGATPDQIQSQIGMTRDIAQVMREVADEIGTEKHATAQDAEQALQQKMNEVLTRAVRTGTPSTRPATQPKE